MPARPVGPRPDRARRHHDLLVALSALTFSAITASIRDDGAQLPGLLTVGLLLAACLPLVARRYRPGMVFVLVVAAEATRFALMETTGDVTAFVVPVASLVGCYTLTRSQPGRRSWPYPLLGTAVLVAGALVGSSGRHALIDVLLAYHSMLAVAVLGGVVQIRARRLAALHRRAEDAERSRHEEARRQVVAERVRIARDLHDVLAHHITLVNAQAGVAGYLLDTDPGAARRALADITEHTQGALRELRATVGLLRSADDDGAEGDRAPTPGLYRIGELVEDFRSAGTSVSSSVVGAARPLSSLADLAAYRIVQESLTNARKHAPGATVSIVLTWSTEALDLMVVNGPASGGPAQGGGTGHGLVGMRERALAAGGSLRLERPRAGGFLVTATLPTDPPVSDDAPSPAGPGILSA